MADKYSGKTVLVKQYKKGAGVVYPTTGHTARFGSLEKALQHADSFQDMGATIKLVDTRKMGGRPGKIY